LLSRTLCAALALGLLAGCGAGSGGLRSPFGAGRSATPAAATPIPPSNDPVIAYAARALPGQEGRVTLAGGQSATVRVVRAYIAASGRECREVLVGAGLAERTRLVCAAETGWADARPLLRGGGGGPP